MQLSSSEEPEEDLDAMFPTATTSLTPQNSNVENLRQFSELSPPSSQDPIDPRNSGNDPSDYGANGGEGSSSNIHDLMNSESPMDHPTNREKTIAEREPGASWNHRKQKDEEDRVKEQLLDKNFSLCMNRSECHPSSRRLTIAGDFGDIYNEKDMSDEV